MSFSQSPEAAGERHNVHAGGGGAYSSAVQNDADPTPVPRSLVWATDIDVLPERRVVERRNGYLLIRSPANPTHYWGNLLLFEDAPAPGDGDRWEKLFDAAFGDEQHLAELFGSEVSWTHRRRTFTFRFVSAESFVECFADYYGPTLKALEAAGSGRDALVRDLRDLVLSWNRLEQPGPVAVPGMYLESVGLRG